MLLLLAYEASRSTPLYSVVVKSFLVLAELSFTVPDAVGSSFPLSSKLFHLLNGHGNPTGQEPMAVLGKKFTCSLAKEKLACAWYCPVLTIE